MENELTFTALRTENICRCNEAYHPLHDWSPTDWATAMAGECGEACNLIKKLRRLDDGEKSYNRDLDADSLITQIGTELADVVIYADLLAARLGINLGIAVAKKFNVVSNLVGSSRRLNIPEYQEFKHGK